MIVAHCREAHDRRTDALRASHEAIEMLSKPFLAKPELLAHWMVQKSLTRCQGQGVKSDAVPLKPLLPTVMTVLEQSNHASGQGETA